MSTMETAEEIVTIMSCCSACYQKRYEVKPSDEILCMLTDRCCRQILSDQIQKDRSTTSSKGEKKESRPATDKQLSFIIDLGGDPHWQGTSFEASKEIERLKGK